MPNCAKCDSTVPAGGKFCPKCRSPQVRADLEKYEKAFAQFAADGVLDDGELSYLSRLRKKLGISDQEHARLLNDSNAFENNPVSIAFDPNHCVLAAGQPARLTLKITNSNSEDRFVSSFKLSTYCSTNKVLRNYPGDLVLPSEDEEVVCGLGIPSAGTHYLEGAIEASFDDDRVFRALFKLPGLLEVQATPAVQGRLPDIHIEGGTFDAGNAAMVKDAQMNVNVNLGGHGRTAEFKHSDRGSWRAVECKAASMPDYTRWHLQRGGVVAEPLGDSEVQGEPLPCRGIRLSVKSAGSKRNKLVWLMGGDRVTFGRDNHKSDLRLAVEPYQHLADADSFTLSQFEQQDDGNYVNPDGVVINKHQLNLLRSWKVSGKHLALECLESGARLVDIGGSKAHEKGPRGGTTIDGQALGATGSVPLTGVHQVHVAGVLKLETHTVIDDEGVVHGLWVKRVDNRPELSYLMMCSGGLGLWPGTRSLFGPRAKEGKRAPVLLYWHLGGPCIHNLSETDLAINDELLAAGSRRALAQHNRIHIGQGQAWKLGVIEVRWPHGT